MSTHENYLHQMLEDLRIKLLTMSAKTQQVLENAYIALAKHDLEAAKLVLRDDSDIDEMENQIDEDALNILARAQPVARDLRFVVTSLRMVLDLERIGDESVYIAKQLILMNEKAGTAFSEELTAYAKHAKESYEKAIASFQEGNKDLALEVCNSDKANNKLILNLMHRIMECVVDNSADPWNSMHSTMIARALDRIYRRAQNIAEHTFFMVDGVSIKHKKSK